MTGQKQLWKYQKGKADAANQRRTDKYSGQTNQSRKKKHAHTSMIHKTLHTDQTKYNKNREKKEWSTHITTQTTNTQTPTKS